MHLKFYLLPLCLLFLQNLHAQVDFESSNLPIIFIDTNEGEEIPDEPKVEATMGIIDNGPGATNNIDDPRNGYDGIIGIELRGSSSQDFPKNGYGFETRDSEGLDIDVALLGLPEEEDWVLYGPFSDKSLIRNSLIYTLAGSLMDYAPRVRFCELVINDEYWGVYILTEKLKRDKNRVDVSKLNPDEITGDDLTGGYIIKLDKTSGAVNDGWESAYLPPNAAFDYSVIFYQYHYPKPDLIVDEQRAYIQNFIGEFEDVMQSADFADPENGYPKYIDTETFIDFMLMNELARNVDGYRLSSYFYKDKDSIDTRLKAGPIWDFNLAFGNADYCEGGNPEGWGYDFNNFCNGDFWLLPFWWYRLLEDTNFVQQRADRWNTLRANQLSDEQIFGTLDSMANLLSDAQSRNFEQWDILGQYVWPNNFVGNTYEDEIGYLTYWITERLAWLDENINAATDIVAIPDPKGEILVYPNPAKEMVHFVGPPNTLFSKIVIYNAIGQKVATLQNRGEERLTWISKEVGLFFYSFHLFDETISGSFFKMN